MTGETNGAAASGFATELAAVLADAGLRPRLSASRVSISSLYDPVYRVCIIASVFQILGKARGDVPALNTTILKLAQFLAARPTLLPRIEAWLQSDREAPEPLSWYLNLMPSGFRQDTLHDRVIEYLLVTRELSESGKNLVWGEATVLNRAWAATIESGLFVTEREILANLRNLRLTIKAVGG